MSSFFSRRSPGVSSASSQIDYSRQVALPLSRTGDSPRTLLLEAVERGDDQAIKLIIAKEPKLVKEGLDADKQTLLHLAAAHQMPDLIRHLIAQKGVDISSIKDQDNNLAIHTACRVGCVETLQAMIGTYVDKVVINSPFLRAALQSQKEATALVTAENLIRSKNKLNQTAVYVAVANNHPSAVAKLLGYSPPGNTDLMLKDRDQDGCDPLKLAVKHDFTEVVKVILNRLQQAPKKSTSIVSALQHKDTAGNTCLHHAAANNNREVALLLLSEPGAHKALKLRNQARQTPIDIAAAKQFHDLQDALQNWKNGTYDASSELASQASENSINAATTSLSDLAHQDPGPSCPLLTSTSHLSISEPASCDDNPPSSSRLPYQGLDLPCSSPNEGMGRENWDRFSPPSPGTVWDEGTRPEWNSVKDLSSKILSLEPPSAPPAPPETSQLEKEMPYDEIISVEDGPSNELWMRQQEKAEQLRQEASELPSLRRTVEQLQAQLTEARSAYDAELTAVRQEHDLVLSAVQAEHAQEICTQAAELPSLRQTIEQLRAQLAKAQNAHGAELTALRQEHGVALSDIRQEHAQAICKQADELSTLKLIVKRLQDQQLAVESTHEAKVNAVRQECNMVLDVARAGHEMALSELRQEHTREIQARQEVFQRSAAAVREHLETVQKDAENKQLEQQQRHDRELLNLRTEKQQCEITLDATLSSLARIVHFVSANTVKSSLVAWACESSDTALLSSLIAAACPLDQCNEVGNAGVHIACQKGDTECLSMLLRAGADVNKQNQMGDTALHVACENGNQECLVLLLESAANPNTQNQVGNTPLHIACLTGNEDVTSSLLNAGASVHIQNQDLDAPLHVACRLGHPRLVTLLLTHGAPADLLNQAGSSPLQEAVQRMDLTVLSLFLEQQPLFMVDLLFLACSRGAMRLVEYLAEGGPAFADAVKATKDGCTPLHIACQHGNLNLVQLLLRGQPDINALNQEGKTPAMVALQYRRMNVALYLCQLESEPEPAAEPEKPPSGFFCPISEELMRNAVVAPDGHSYEEASLRQWLAQNSTSPITRMRMTMDECLPNRYLRGSIEDWLRAHPNYQDA